MSTVLRVVNLTHIYPGPPPVEAVKDVSFGVKEGEIVALLGPNGAGKTTTLKCILQLVEPTRGDVEVYGRSHRDRHHLYRHIAAVLEGNRNLFWRLTPRQNLEVFAAYSGLPPSRVRSEVHRWLERLGLTALDREVRTLSRGQQQRVALAAALVRGTPLLVLDEPTLGLDVEAKRELITLIRGLVQEDGKTVLLSSHQMDVVEALADRVVVIQQGRVVAEDTPRALRRMFEARTYRILVEGVPVSHLREVLIPWHGQVQSDRDGRIRVDVTLPRDADLYAVFQALATAGAVIHEVHRDLPDLEEAYLRLIQTVQNRETTA